ncbi:MAG: hypothetical protein JSR82_04585 [Verrucomicrobia bacterium]|nr:hypothetical protein [Verrucomicrobiota bacterium]
MRCTLRSGLFCVLLLAGCASPRPAERADSISAQAKALAEARRAWQALQRPGASPRVLTDYNRATNLFLDRLEGLPPTRWRELRALETPAGRIALELAPPPSRGEWNLATFERVEGIDRAYPNPRVPQAVRAGLGVPLIARVRPRQHRGQRDPAHPTDGQFAPATALLQFDKAGRRARLQLVDPREIRSLRLGRQTFPVAADFATAEHRRLGGRFRHIALAGLFRPARFAGQRGLFHAGPYRSDKIPVILVHGLVSDPHIWQDLSASIDSDPELGRRYQVWYFLYPTGLGVPTSALGFRQALRQARAFHDPGALDPAARRMVLVGHSMGGLLSHLLSLDSGEAFRRAYFRRPLEESGLTSGQFARTRELLHWRKDPGVARAIFVATPHRGAQLAVSPLARLVASLVDLSLAAPQQAAQDLLHIDARALHPELRALHRIAFNSIETLAPSHPYFRAVADRPIRVPFHSIIGDRGRGDTPRSSDGVVPYWSSHLPGAASECIVPEHHSCAQHPQTVAEILRILRLHLRAGR